jgi:hypothetical protein
MHRQEGRRQISKPPQSKQTTKRGPTKAPSLFDKVLAAA